MSELTETGKKSRMAKFKKRVKVAIFILLIILVIAGAISIVSNYFETESKTIKIGFEDIGELDTQVAYTTVIGTIDDPRKIFGVKIPFTESKYIYSYDVVVKAGLDFSKIRWKEGAEKIRVSMPAPRVTDCYIDEDSGKVYYEKESIFSPITFAEEMESRKDLTERGRKDAVAKGLINNAKKNAEKLLKSFFNNNKKYKDYEVEFKWEK